MTGFYFRLPLSCSLLDFSVNIECRSAKPLFFETIDGYLHSAIKHRNKSPSQEIISGHTKPGQASGVLMKSYIPSVENI
jgi:hypothetical protein